MSGRGNVCQAIVMTIGLLSGRVTVLLGYYPSGCLMELLSVGLLSSQTTACPGCFLREVPIRLLSVRAPVREPIQPHSQTDNYQEEEGLPCPFLKTEKSALILEKKVLIVSTFELNFPFKM